MAEKYKFINPTGKQDAVDTHPLAERLNTLDGKTIVFSASGEADVMNPLWERVQKDYPNVNWVKKQTYTTNPHEITEEEKKTCDALIQGVAW
jgi:tricorn protease-like protein